MRTGTWLNLIVSLYVASLALPAFGEGPDPTWGYSCLITIPYVCFYPAWWANPCLLVGCVRMGLGRDWEGIPWGTVAGLLAASFVVQVPVAELRAGYFAWIASLLALIVAGIERTVAGRTRAGKPEIGDL